jgi:hypothetical protein
MWQSGIVFSKLTDAGTNGGFMFFFSTSFQFISLHEAQTLMVLTRMLIEKYSLAK